MQFQDLTGQKYNRLTVIELAPKQGRRTMWKCRCDCGNIIVARAENLKSGNTKSCGCLAKDHPSNYKHGYSHTKIEYIYQAMKNRCYNPKNYEYHLYGGRGITICDEWLNDRVKFYEWAYENGYKEGAKQAEQSLDRIDVNKGYSPENCRFVDAYVQANNKRTNVFVEHNGERHTLAEWARIFNIDYHLLYDRYISNGWSFIDAISPIKRVNQFG